MGLNERLVPYTYPNLSNQDVTTSPFTIVFSLAGSSKYQIRSTSRVPHLKSIDLGIAASAMNTVLLTSVLSAGNHALFVGSRILHSLALSKDPDSGATHAQAPAFLGWTTRRGVPYVALLATCSVSAVCFGTSFIGKGQLWVWLQNLVGVSNQVSLWLSHEAHSHR
jgi:AAT family amino acid transporter